MHRLIYRPRIRLVAATIIGIMALSVDFASTQNRDAEIEALRKQVEALNSQHQGRQIELLKQQLEAMRQREAERQKQVEELQRQIERLQARPPQEKPPETAGSALDQAIQKLETTPQAPAQAPAQPATPSLLSRRMGGATFRLIDISADLLVAAGGSTANDDDLQTLEAGAHDPNRNGFTLQQLELSFAGAVDPYFTAEAHAIYSVGPDGDQDIELEEAFATTQGIPFGLEIEGGYFFTEFGIINHLHPHAWDWLDQPVINTRIFGPDGMRQAGMRMGWLTPLPWFSQFHAGVQNANGETMPSFCGPAVTGGGHNHDGGEEEEAVGMRPFVECDVDSPAKLVYLARWENAWALSRTVSSRIGLSSLFGPNASGPDGRTIVAGTDLKMTWRPARNFRGWPFLRWQTEFIWRHYKADNFTAEETDDADHEDDTHDHEELEDFDSAILRDWGLYTQFLYGFTYRWAGGLRFEYADGSGDSGEQQQDPFRDLRYRLSPLLVFYPTEFSRLRLQYNYDWADHRDGHTAHTVWLGLEVLYGAHAAHKY